jgi:hypothetical protein
MTSSRKERGVPAPVIVKSNPEERGKDIDSDYAYAREQLHNLVIRGNDALEGAMELAKEQGSPRSYEVVGGMIKTLADATKDLMNLQKDMEKLKEDTHQTVNNNLNVTLTTHELQKMISGKD